MTYWFLLEGPKLRIPQPLASSLPSWETLFRLMQQLSNMSSTLDSSLHPSQKLFIGISRIYSLHKILICFSQPVPYTHLVHQSWALLIDFKMSFPPMWQKPLCIWQFWKHDLTNTYKAFTVCLVYSVVRKLYDLGQVTSLFKACFSSFNEVGKLNGVSPEIYVLPESKNMTLTVVLPYLCFHFPWLLRETFKMKWSVGGRALGPEFNLQSVGKNVTWLLGRLSFFQSKFQLGLYPRILLWHSILNQDTSWEYFLIRKLKNKIPRQHLFW
jgi:hypothetical protein